MASTHGIRILQTHDAHGQAAESESRFDILTTRSNMGRGMASIALEFITPLQPQVTSDHGILSYVEPGGGSGWLILEMNDGAIAEVTELVRAREEHNPGQLDPLRVQNTVSAAPVTPLGGNPGWAILAGVLVTVLGVTVLSFSVGLLLVGDIGGSALTGLLGVVLGIAGVLVVLSGRARRSQWILARAAAFRGN